MKGAGTGNTKPPRMFTCPDCGATYQHDDAHKHATKDCPKVKKK
jgi:hypothetical protein